MRKWIVAGLALSSLAACAPYYYDRDGYYGYNRPYRGYYSDRDYRGDGRYYGDRYYGGRYYGDRDYDDR